MRATHIFAKYSKCNHPGLFCTQGKVLPEPYEAGNTGDGELETTQFREGPLGNLCNSPATIHLFSEIPFASDSVRSSAAMSSTHGNLNGKNQTDSSSPCSGTLGTQSKPSGPVYSKISTSPTQSSLLKIDQTVQLAPGLPPLKLPPTVRVLSHSGTTLLQASGVHCNAKASSEYSTNNSSLGCLAGQRK